MSLWGKSESLAAGSGTVVINLSTKAVTGTNSTFSDAMVGKVITVGAAGTCGEAVIASRSSNTAISIASTQFIVPDGSGNVTGVAYTVTEKPISPFFLELNFLVRSKIFDLFNEVFLPSAAQSPRDRAVPEGASFLCL